MLITQQDQYHHKKWVIHHVIEMSIKSDEDDSLDDRVNFDDRPMEQIEIF